MEDNIEKEGLGDKVEKVIKKALPKIAKKLENCVGCKKRKVWLNNINAKFSYEE